MSEFKQYSRKQIAELRPYEEGEVLSERVSISQADKDAGSPKVGDMIARNPKNHNDQWLVAQKYFEDNFESVQSNSEQTIRLKCLELANGDLIKAMAYYEFIMGISKPVS